MFTVCHRLLRLTAVLLAGGFAASVLTPLPTASAIPAKTAQLDHGGLPRTYVVHAPLGVERPSALVINLHAAGGTGGGQAALTHYDAVADANGFVVAYPDGIDLSWADGRGASVPDRQGVDDVGFISALTSKLAADYGIPGGRVFITGLSAGAFMANRMACERADLFAAVAPVAGTLGTNVACNPSRPVSVFATHGTVDPIVPYGGGGMTGRGGASTVVAAPAMADRWRQVDGCPPPVDETLFGAGYGQQIQRTTSAPCAAGTAVVFNRVDGGGHTWPGAPALMDAAGATTNVIDASVASWQFFDTHGR